MRRDARAYLWDAQTAIDSIRQFTRGRSGAEYRRDAMLRSAVERQFEILGEALNSLRRVAPSVAGRISELGEIVDFRNLLIHGYATVDHDTVWRTIENDHDRLYDQLVALLTELGNAP
jgi:uncharacterized protein with HEPN domain